ncbi:GNAT family N-acetyltransferase [Hymenobacter sp. HSC-4F20]|uniref:GNAT family N-acetyltransferase n=1 Tax=Hymenobacter sp. HSC-4F20 TaxID=2864135 RepID=UPI001C72BE05|nr:GNAT family N-acetyltransferase [Hymenobacter sp. HSC-4F20]MBX0290638.1 GNAT family N-acetyltransferase [Hymenobacter sp. HSC-4F20]
MEHPLDNPIWNALRTGNQPLAIGDELARVLPREVGAFAGLADYSPRAFARLHELSPAGAPTVLFTADPISLPPGWQQLMHKELAQLVYPQPDVPAVDSSHLVDLQEQDVPAMRALTGLTNPGPFLARTIDFGGYYGIFQNGQLVAMAGQRLQPSPYTEISAVCTHPAYLGRGYANLLVRHQVARILAAGSTPFLHVYEDNTPAYALYQKLGFQLRQRLHVYVLEKHTQ